MRQLLTTTALALVVPHYIASYITQQPVPHLVLITHTVFRIKFRYHELLVCAYEVRDLLKGKGFGWHVTADAAYASAFWGSYKEN